MRQADAGHLSTEALLRALDDELSESQTSAIEAHLSACEECRARTHALGVLSVRLESWVSSVQVPQADNERAMLLRKLDASDRGPRKRAPFIETSSSANRRIRAGVRLWHWAASAGVAAAIVIAAMLSPGVRSLRQAQSSSSAEAMTSQTFQIAGETFVALPYSNSDLPLTSPQIVQMEVPVTSLAEAGIVFEPVSSEQANPDRAVLADVLLGADGEPLGVHVLNAE